jgi:hypothetical protein
VNSTGSIPAEKFTVFIVKLLQYFQGAMNKETFIVDLIKLAGETMGVSATAFNMPTGQE